MKIQRKITYLVLAVLVISFLLPYTTQAEDVQGSKQQPAQVDDKRIAGKWLRQDGGYVLELSDVQPDGRLKAAYFNPRPIHVLKAEWRRVDGQLRVFVELQAANYPGSTYTLAYVPERDCFAGYYYQAALGQTFDVIFVRADRVK